MPILGGEGKRFLSIYRATRAGGGTRLLSVFRNGNVCLFHTLSTGAVFSWKVFERNRTESALFAHTAEENSRWQPFREGREGRCRGRTSWFSCLPHQEVRKAGPGGGPPTASSTGRQSEGLWAPCSALLPNRTLPLSGGALPISLAGLCVCCFCPCFSDRQHTSPRSVLGTVVSE